MSLKEFANKWQNVLTVRGPDGKELDGPAMELLGDIEGELYGPKTWVSRELTAYPSVEQR